MRVANIPAETAYLRSTTGSAVSEDWVVETEGIELATPHAVVEPVSDTRVRNGNFRCRDGSAKTAVPPLRDRCRDAQRFERPPQIWWDTGLQNKTPPEWASGVIFKSRITDGKWGAFGGPSRTLPDNPTKGRADVQGSSLFRQTLSTIFNGRLSYPAIRQPARL